MTPSPKKKKKVVRKVVRRKPSGKAAPAAVSLEPVSDLFSTRPETPETVQVPANAVILVVNGNNKGTMDTSGLKFGEFVIQHANRAGIRSFSVYVDGMKADTSYKEKPMTAFHKVEIVAKDQRG